MNAIAIARKFETYADLLRQIRNDLRRQHPEWIQANGQCPMCDRYESRLLKLLDGSTPGQSVVAALVPNAEPQPFDTNASTVMKQANGSAVFS
jgi:hypothetical protein